MTDLKCKVVCCGLEMSIPADLADSRDVEAIKGYMRDAVEAHLYCQSIAAGLTNEMPEENKRAMRQAGYIQSIKVDVEAEIQKEFHEFMGASELKGE